MGETSADESGVDYANSHMHVIVRTHEGQMVLRGRVVSSVVDSETVVFEPQHGAYGHLEVRNTDYWDEDYTVCRRDGRRVGECLSCVVGVDILG